jgi:hypothetical protein
LKYSVDNQVVGVCSVLSTAHAAGRHKGLWAIFASILETHLSSVLIK